MQVTTTHFKNLVSIAHSANVKHNNLSCSVFTNNVKQIASYASNNKSFASVISKAQAKTVQYCIALANQL